MCIEAFFINVTRCLILFVSFVILGSKASAGSLPAHIAPDIAYFEKAFRMPVLALNKADIDSSLDRNIARLEQAGVLNDDGTFKQKAIAAFGTDFGFRVNQAGFASYDGFAGSGEYCVIRFGHATWDYPFFFLNLNYGEKRKLRAISRDIVKHELGHCAITTQLNADYKARGGIFGDFMGQFYAWVERYGKQEAINMMKLYRQYLNEMSANAFLYLYLMNKDGVSPEQALEQLEYSIRLGDYFLRYTKGEKPMKIVGRDFFTKLSSLDPDFLNSAVERLPRDPYGVIKSVFAKIDDDDYATFVAMYVAYGLSESMAKR